ncbi:hypothetical protein PRN20_06005 [Devosia sp. ZB163]|uniref:hypothetical protein n=1 Tax=Devosia sp. ZB163 TaxID=3025938 RepID=UPI002360228E|nr:hypothetical protein [Devosia sp. ZB163]MDC9823278.1 hypothetical protein [Devosia sp. ZB163]
MASTPAKVMDRIASNRARGKSARLYLRRNIATFPIREVAKVPRSTLKRLEVELPTDATAKPISTPKKAEPVDAKSSAAAPKSGTTQNPERVPSLLELLILGIVVVTAVTVAASSGERHARWLLHHVGLFSGDEMGLCLRLDALTDDCSFEVRANDLSMTRVAELIGVPLATLAAKNPNLSPNDPLPSGAHVRIKRTGDRSE